MVISCFIKWKYIRFNSFLLETLDVGHEALLVWLSVSRRHARHLVVLHGRAGLLPFLDSLALHGQQAESKSCNLAISFWWRKHAFLRALIDLFTSCESSGYNLGIAKTGSLRPCAWKSPLYYFSCSRVSSFCISSSSCLILYRISWKWWFTT